jgi:hypothetical protein
MASEPKKRRFSSVANGATRRFLGVSEEFFEKFGVPRLGPLVFCRVRG